MNNVMHLVMSVNDTCITIAVTDVKLNVYVLMSAYIQGMFLSIVHYFQMLGNRIHVCYGIKYISK